MTPTEQGDDRAKLIIEMSNLLHRHFQAQRKATVEAFANAQGDLVNFITADRKRVALEARIDELSAIYGWSQGERTPLIFYPEHRSSDFAQMAAKGMGTNFTVRERIAALKAQQE